MIVLQEHSLTPKDVIRPTGMKLDLAERQSSAQPDFSSGTPPEWNDWIRTTEWPAAGMVWRVKDLDDQTVGGGRWSMKLEPIICTLKDKNLKGKITTETIAGKKGATTVTAEAAFRYVLKQQKKTDWKLGDFAFRDAEPYSFNGDSLYDALETITASLENAYWEFDTTKYPFVLHVRQKDKTIGGEMRLSRNITGAIKKSITRSGMYTVFKPIGKNNLTLPEVTLSKNTDLYGEIEKTETDQSLDTVAKLRMWGKARLRNHCEPVVSITVPGLNLSRATGEDLDDIKINRYCRIPLPKLGDTIKEYVTKLSWADCIKEPENMTVTLANTMNDVSSIVREIAKSSGGGGRGARDDAANAEEDHAWFEDTNDHVGMVAMAIIGKDPDGIDWKRVANIYADGDGIHSEVTAMKGDVKRYGTRLDQNEKSIGMVVGTYDSGGNFIKAGQICLAINESGDSEATIEANKIRLLGQTIANTVTADLIQSKVNLMAALRVKKLTVATSLQFESGDGTTITGSQAADIIRNLRIKPSGNTYTLQKITCGDGSWTDVDSFSRAITSWGVAGSSGKVKVTAQPQNQTKEVPVSISGGNTISSNGQYNYDIYYENDSGDDVKISGTTKTITVSVHPNSMTLTRAQTDQGIYYGRLYYYDTRDESYKPVINESRYWYYSTTNRVGTNDVFY